MQHTNPVSLLAIAGGVLCLHAPAQTFRPVPAHANAVDGQQYLSVPFGIPAFRTQILVDSATVGPNGAVIHGISFRLDREALGPLPATQVPNVTIELSHTSVALGSLSPDFATNVTQATTVAFQGTVTLPAPQPVLAGPAPWNIVIQFPLPFSYTAVQGNLLIDIVADNPGGGGGLGMGLLDAMQAGGSATPFGTGGLASARLSVVNHLSTMLVPREVSPHHTIDFVSRLTFAPPGVLALGIAPQATPIDLAPLGAPANFVYIDPIVFTTLAWVQQPTLPFLPEDWLATVPLVLANDPALIGVLLFGQTAILEPLVNPLGLSLGNAVEVRIGDAFETFPMQQVYSVDPTATQGGVVDFTLGGGPEYGAVAIRFEGLFF